MTLSPSEHSIVWLSFQGGESIAEIAARYDVDTRTVEGWLRKQPRYRYSRATNGEWLRSLRHAAGKTLVEAAELCGCGKSYLAAIETNQRPAPQYVERAYEQHFGGESGINEGEAVARLRVMGARR